MTLKYGKATMFIIDTVEDETFFALKSNVGWMFLKVPERDAVKMAQKTVDELGAECGNFAIIKNEAGENALLVDEQFEVPSFIEISDEENEKLKSLNEALKELREQEYIGIEVRGEADWELPYDEKRYFRKNYCTEGDLYGITVEMDVANNSARCTVEFEGEVTEGLWFKADTEVAALLLDIKTALDDPNDWLDMMEEREAEEDAEE